MNRRTVIVGVTSTLLSPGSAALGNRGTPAPSPDGYDLTKDASQISTRRFDVLMTPDSPKILIMAMSIGFLNHPGSRARYRHVRRLLEDSVEQANASGPVIAGFQFIPVSTARESTDVIGKFSTTFDTVAPTDDTLTGSAVVVQNGGIAQLFSLEPQSELGTDQAVNTITAICRAAEKRSPDFFARGTLTHDAVVSKNVTIEDILSVAAAVRVVSENYRLIRPDGITDMRYRQ